MHVYTIHWVTRANSRGPPEKAWMCKRTLAFHQAFSLTARSPRHRKRHLCVGIGLAATAEPNTPLQINMEQQKPLGCRGKWSSTGQFSGSMLVPRTFHRNRREGGHQLIPKGQRLSTDWTDWVEISRDMIDVSAGWTVANG